MFAWGLESYLQKISSFAEEGVWFVCLGGRPAPGALRSRLGVVWRLETRQTLRAGPGTRAGTVRVQVTFGSWKRMSEAGTPRRGSDGTAAVSLVLCGDPAKAEQGGGVLVEASSLRKTGVLHVC